ncbi:hypothetical protein MASR1M66_15210 [Aminivibrio sp.]
MEDKAFIIKEAKGLGFFEKYLTVWVVLSILAGIGLGKVAPDFAKALDGMSIYVGGAPVISIPIAVCLFFMMYPIMVKIDFAEVLKAGKSIKPVGLTLFINWAVKPFTMYAIAVFFLGKVFLHFIGSTSTWCDFLSFDSNFGDSYGWARSCLRTAFECFRSLCGGAISRVASCSASLPAPRWSWCGATSPRGMPDTRS